MKLSPTQARALARIQQGPLYAGNEEGITRATIRALVNRDLIEVRWSAQHGYTRRGTYWCVGDWAATAKSQPDLEVQ